MIGSLVRETFYFARLPSLWWFVPLCLGVLGLLILYWRRAHGHVGLGMALGLTTLRFLLFGLLLVYLFQPTVLRQTLQYLPPEVAVLVDTSASMEARESGGTRSAAIRPLLAGEDSPLRRALAPAGRVHYFTFDRDVGPADLESLLQGMDNQELERKGTGTDIGGALASVRNSNPGNPPSAILLLSDGAANLGPADASEAARRLGAPVVAVAVGDPEKFRDLQILDLRAPDLSFLRHETRVSFRLRALGFAGKRVTLALKSGGQLLATRTVELKRDQFDERLEFIFTPEEVGLLRLSVEAFSQLGEHTRANNSVDFSIQVLRDKHRVLYVSGRPSWNYRFMRRALKLDPGIDLVSFVILRTINDEVDIPQSELSLISFPTERIFTRELNNFDLLIFDNFSFRPYFPFYYLENVAKFVEQGGAFLMLGGDSSFGAGGYNDSPLESILPIEMNRTPRNYVLKPVGAALTEAGKTHPITRLSPDPEENLKIWKSLPQLRGYNPSARAKSGATTLAVRGSGDAAGDGAPLLAVMEAGKGRTMAILSSSFWRWSFEMVGRDQGNRPYLNLVKRAVDWLVKSPSLDRARLSSLRREYKAGEETEVRFRVLDSRYQPAAGAEVRGALIDPSGNRVPLKFSPAREPGLYVAHPRLRTPGSYRVQAEARRGDRALGESELLLDAQTFNVEEEDAAPRPEFLRALARTSGGLFFEAAAFDAEAASRVAKLLTSRTRVNLVQERELAVWKIEYAFAALVLLLGAEWLLRRRRGLA
ncbi:MAG: glutamine amidotransferase [Nitrospinota bacterium]